MRHPKCTARCEKERSGESERGQATLLVASGSLAVALGVAIVLLTGQVVADRARAQTAADAAALAGALDGRAAAESVAAANGARLERFVASRGFVSVVVRVGRVEARAVATLDHSAAGAARLRPPGVHPVHSRAVRRGDA